MEALLSQALEESRYHRQFHHTVFVLAVTLYSGLLAIQLNSPIVLAAGFVKCFLILGVGVAIPLYFIYLIFLYHENISKLNCIVYELGTSLISSSSINLGRLNSQSPIINAFLFKKYADAVHGNRNLKFVGKGHWFFSGIVVLLVTMNAAAFFR